MLPHRNGGLELFSEHKRESIGILPDHDGFPRQLAYPVTQQIRIELYQIFRLKREASRTIQATDDTSSRKGVPNHYQPERESHKGLSGGKSWNTLDKLTMAAGDDNESMTGMRADTMSTPKYRRRRSGRNKQHEPDHGR